MYMLQTNDKSRLIYLPSTGRQTKTNTRKLARIGKKSNDDNLILGHANNDDDVITNYGSNRMAFKDTRTINYDGTHLNNILTKQRDLGLTVTAPTINVTKPKYNSKTYKTYFANSSQQTNTTNTETDISTQQSETSDEKRNFIQQFFDNHKGYENYYKRNDLISGASNGLGAIGSWFTNNIAINRMKYSPEPVYKQPRKLKTKFNINPQLDQIRDGISAGNRNIENNTASSKVALARKQGLGLQGLGMRNQLYSQKENIETQLINQDTMNQQQVAHANVDTYNTWKQGERDFLNKKAELRSENTNALIQNINSGVQDYITRGEKRELERENLLAMMAGYQHVDKELLERFGSRFYKRLGINPTHSHVGHSTQTI